MGLRDLLFGRELRSSEDARQRIGTLTGVSLLGLDALSSAAYGPEVALVVMIPLGRESVRVLVPLLVCIVAILLVVFVSYRQTIHAYPNGGGSYVVAKQNLGARWGLFAAAALGLDYVLNVAVGISAGIAALVSAVPALHPHMIELCIATLLVLTAINLRGVRASGTAWRIPTWTFVACLGFVLLAGVYRALLAGGRPSPMIAPAPLPPAIAPLTSWIVLRAFASGCAAMTGVEAVSNGVPLFHRPAEASRALSVIIAILAVLLLGVGFLCRAYVIGAMDQSLPGYQSVLSQLVAAVVGHGWFYGLTMGAIFAVLTLSANTSFADFPRVCHFLAADEFLPPSFRHRGRRLVYTQGIVLLAVIAGVLLVAFQGLTDRLVQLFAIGAFIAFTLSQSGMVQHWRVRRDEPRARMKMTLNATGAVLTGTTAVVLFVSKFREGAWLTLILIPALVVLLQRMRARHVALEVAAQACVPIEIGDVAPPLVVVPMLGWNRPIENALRFAIQASGDVRAVRVVTEDAPLDELSARWETLVARPARAAGRASPTLDILRSDYREVVDPIVQYVHGVARANPGRVVEVVVPELFERHWYDFFVRNRYPELLRTMLLLDGDPRVVVVSAPWYLTK
ncbi:MAG: Amino acid permease [Labilithrix sp.]|nr:Amino acid permease [Labilithrix sp.]